eukprot:GILJ01013198.1.p1 GENE.GILJ01013198.1~~GILJ01013198.1.p1  ORF type:complete len:1101 (+),score=222.81 GILJ01013198.1:46-3348(+)
MPRRKRDDSSGEEESEAMVEEVTPTPQKSSQKSLSQQSPAKKAKSRQSVSWPPVSTNDVKARRSLELNYAPGSIMRIRLHNFLTHKDVDFHPGPRLNLVIGPNGSGKSAIICAIVLGLGGHPKVLGRADQVSSFIKHGEQSGFIEICLNGAQDDLVIHRTIQTDNSSVWKLNGRVAKEKDVVAAVRNLHIQVENLCQVLAQDRVGDFAKLKPTELLKETEKAVGGEDMVNKHEALVKLRKTQKEKETTVNQKRETLDNLVRLNADLERDVMRHEEREKLRKKVELLKKKKPWIEFNAAREEARRLKEERATATDDLKKAEEQELPRKQEIEAEKKKVVRLKQEAEKEDQNIRSLEKDRTRLVNQLDDMQTKVDNEHDQLKLVQKSRQEHANKIKRTEEELEALQHELTKLPALDHLSSKMDSIRQRSREVSQTVTQLLARESDQREQLRPIQNDIRQLESSLHELDNVQKRRWESINRDNRSRDTYTAYKWIQENAHKFQQKVYGPIAIEISVASADHAKIVEQHLGIKTLTSFVVSCRSDQEVLMRQFQSMKIRNGVYHPTNHNFNAPFNIDDVRQFGLTHFLQDVIECPDIVRAAICATGYAHTTMLGTTEVNRNMEALIEYVGSRVSGMIVAYSPDTSFRAKRTYDGRDWSTGTNPVKRPQILTAVDLQAREELEHRLRECKQHMEAVSNQGSGLREEIQKLKSEESALNKERDSFVNAQQRQRQIQGQLTRKQQQLSQLNGDQDFDQNEEHCKQTIIKINQQRYSKVKELRAMLERETASLLAQNGIKLKIAESSVMVRRLEEAFAEATAALDALRRRLAEVERIIREAINRAMKLKETAMKAIEGMDEEEAAKFAELPDSMEEIDNMIHEFQAQVDALVSNPNAVRQYNERKVQIASLQHDLAEDEGDLKTQNDRIEIVKATWLPEVRDLVQRMNRKFSQGFEMLGCAGELKLEEHDDFDNFAINVGVKFRESEDMVTLSAHRQSGGEKSVSTILYLMAMQENSHYPFRVVDEINQGMDPKNERKIFKQMIDSICRNPENQSQYFMVTPKLLPNLDFDERMTVLTVYNGPYQTPQSEWKLDEFIYRRSQTQSQLF